MRHIGSLLVLVVLLISPGFSQDGTLSHSLDDTLDSRFLCGLGSTSAHADNYFYRVFSTCYEFDVNDEIEITGVEFGVFVADPADGFDTQPITVTILLLPEGYDGDVPELDDLEDIDGATVELEVEEILEPELLTADFDTPVAIPCGRSFIVEIHSPNGLDVSTTDPPPDAPDDSHQFSPAFNECGQTAATYARFPECGVDDITLVSELSANNAQLVLTVDYDIVTTDGCDCDEEGLDCHLPSRNPTLFTYRDTTEGSSSPEAEISEDKIVTIDDTITIDKDALVQDVTCTVDLTHTWLEDLEVTLTAPDFTEVTLLTVGTGEDLLATFADSAREHGEPFDEGDRMKPSGPGDMSDFGGGSADGDWTLTVSDSTNVDGGTLHEWSLMVQTLLDIPAADSDGVEVELVIGDSETDVISDLDVFVVGRHDDPSELVIAIESPDGTSVTIVDGTLDADLEFFSSRIGDVFEAGATCDGYEDLETSGPGDLSEFDGESVAGTWLITVVDDSGIFTSGEIAEVILSVVPDVDDAESECVEKEPDPPEFLRGDVNGDGAVTVLADAIYLLLWGFNDAADPPCMDAADVDGNNEVSALVDALALLEWVFLDGDAPPEPGATSCGADDDDDLDVECETVADLCA